MITVTEGTKRLFRIVASHRIPEGKTLRLDAIGHGKNGRPLPSVRIGEPQEGDCPVWDQGNIVLYVSNTMSEAHDGCVLDLEEFPDGLRCVLGPPEAGHNARS